jgi:hypothetical protein
MRPVDPSQTLEEHRPLLRPGIGVERGQRILDVVDVAQGSRAVMRRLGGAQGQLGSGHTGRGSRFWHLLPQLQRALELSAEGNVALVSPARDRRHPSASAQPIR